MRNRNAIKHILLLTLHKCISNTVAVTYPLYKT